MTVINMDCLAGMAAMPSSSVDLIVTDPPYDIKCTKAGGAGSLSKSIQNMNDELVGAAITSGFNVQILDEMVRVCRGINMYIFCNKAQLPMYFSYFVGGLGCSFDLIKWVKTNPSPTFYNKYMSDTEYCFYARKKGRCMPVNYADASTLYHAPMNVVDKKLYKHPTIKPLPLVERLIRNSSEPGALVLDPFTGSGTTGHACINLDRAFLGFELSEEYAAIATARIEDARK